MADDEIQRPCAGFEGWRLIARGNLADVAASVKAVVDRGAASPVLVFDDRTGEQIDIDYRGTIDEVLGRLRAPIPPTSRGPGRPKLGVEAHEVTLMPRHWAWLRQQPGGASVALRKLVEEASRDREGTDRTRRAREVCYRFLSAMAGNFPGFEEASRALFAGDRATFHEQIAAWPPDVRDHTTRVAEPSFVGGERGANPEVASG